MSTTQYYSVTVLLLALLAGQVIAGTVLGPWWRPRIRRRDNPGTYWFVLAVQGAILILVLVTGRSWHVR